MVYCYRGYILYISAPYKFLPPSSIMDFSQSENGHNFHLLKPFMPKLPKAKEVSPEYSILLKITL